MIFKHKILYAFKWLYCWVMGIRVGLEYRYYSPDVGGWVRCQIQSINGDSVTTSNMTFLICVCFERSLYGGACSSSTFRHGSFSISQFLDEFVPV